MKYTMLEDNVLLEPILSDSDKSNGGIILPDKLKTRPIIAKVLAVGCGQKLEDGSRFPMMLNVNDVVAVPQKSGDKMHIDGQELLVVPERYILMRLDDYREEN